MHASIPIVGLALITLACGGQTAADLSRAGSGGSAAAPPDGGGNVGGTSIGSGGTAAGGSPSGGFTSTGGSGGSQSLAALWIVAVEDDANVEWDGIRAIDTLYDSVVFASNHWPVPNTQTASATTLGPGSEEIWTEPVEVEAVDIATAAGATYALSRMGDPLYSVVTKLSSDGAVQWKKPAITAAEGSEPHALTIDEYGRATVVGSVYTTSNAPGPSAFVAQLSPDGSSNWTRVAAATTWAVATDIDVDSDMHLYTTIEYSGTLDLEGNFMASFGERELVVAKWGSSGSLGWVENLSTESDEANSRIVVDTSGNSIVAWTSNGTLMVQRLGADGTTTWKRQFGSAKADALALTIGTDAIFVAGTFSGELSLGDKSLSSDATLAYGQGFILKLDLQGLPTASSTLAWSPLTSFCGTYRPISLACDALGSVYVAGGACLSVSQLLKLSP